MHAHLHRSRLDLSFSSAIRLDMAHVHVVTLLVHLISHFKVMAQPHGRSPSRSLTPPHPCARESTLTNVHPTPTWQVKEQVLTALAGTELKTARVDASIVDSLGRAYAVVTPRQTEQQRLEAGIILRAVSAPRVAQGDSKHGMEALIAERLGSFVGDGKPLPTGNRWRRNDKTIKRDYVR